VADWEKKDGNRDEHRQVLGHTPSLSLRRGTVLDGIVAQRDEWLKGEG
jgi:hypothetical protein